MIISKWRYEAELRKAEERGRQKAFDEMMHRDEVMAVAETVEDLSIEVELLARKIKSLGKGEPKEAPQEEKRCCGSCQMQDIPY